MKFIKKFSFLILFSFYVFITLYMMYISLNNNSVLCMYKTNTTMKLINNSVQIIKNDKLVGIHLNYSNKESIIYLNKYILNKKQLELMYLDNKDIINELYDIFLHPIIYTEYNDKIFIKTLTHSLKICNNMDKNFFISNVDLNNLYKDQYLNSNYTVLDKTIFEKIIENSFSDTDNIINNYNIYEEYIPTIEKFVEYSILEQKLNKK